MSVEDIFKLTEMTARLPEVTPQISTSKSKHKHHHRHTSEPSSTSQKPLEMAISPPITTTAPSESPIITTSSDLITSSSSKSSLSSSLEPVQEYKRSSWLHRKKKDTNKSAAASIADEFYQKNAKEDNVLSRIHSINITPLSDIKFGLKKASHQQKESDTSEPESRRHSFDNHINAQEKSLLEAKEEIEFDESKKDLHEKKPEFFLRVTNEDLEKDKDQAHAVIENQIPEEENDEEKEQVITMKFDYFTLPTEVKGLIDAYEHKGKVERKRMVVKFRKGSSLASSSDNTSSLLQEDEEDDYYDDEDEDEDDEDEDEDEDEDGSSNSKNNIYYRDLIIGEYEKINYKNNPVRDIAILTTTISDNIEFIKLIQLSSEGSLDQGPLLDLHVSMFDDQNNDSEVDNDPEEFDNILQNIQSRLVILDAFKKESNVS